MKRLCSQSLVILSLLALTGCTGIPVLVEPDPLPVSEQGYRIPAFAALNPRQTMSFDYLGCVEEAVVCSSGFSGRTSITGVFDARSIIEREFGLAASANLAPTLPGIRNSCVVYVEIEKFLVSKSWANHSASLVFDIEVIGQTPAGRQRVFRKKYRESATSREKGGDDAVPLCVYACVQKTVRKFFDDLSTCRDFADCISVSKENK